MKDNYHSGIKLSMDLGPVSITNGDVKSITLGSPEDYISRITFLLPYKVGTIAPGVYGIDYEGERVSIQIKEIIDRNSDPIFSSGKSMQFGTEGTGVPTLPFIHFTDNRGIYPSILASLIFPKRFASWIDPNHPTGMKMDYDYEKMQVAGPPDAPEKISSIIILNRLFKPRKKWNITRELVAEDVTVFLSNYYKKGYNKPILSRLTALASKGAYKNAVEEYFLNGLEIQSLKSQIISEASSKTIQTEEHLLNEVYNILNNVLIHHIEERRWIEAFWDGERTIKHNNVNISVPRIPKKEIDIQPTFHVLLSVLLSPLGIQVIRESDEGVGTLDFRCLFTTAEKKPMSVGIEFKLAHHKKLKKGITTQLPAYLKAINSSSGIYAVMWFKDKSLKYFKEPSGKSKGQMKEWLENTINESNNKFSLNIMPILFDASIKLSASNL